MNGLPMTNEIQEKVNMLLDKEFFARDESLILLVGDRLLNAVNRGEFIPYFSEITELLVQYNITINRLQFSKPVNELTNNDETSHEPLYDNMSKYKLDVKNITLYKGTDDKNMIVQIHGLIL